MKKFIAEKFDLLKVITVGMLFIAAIILFHTALSSANVWVKFGTFFVLYLAAGYETIIGAFKEFREEPFNEEFLMLVASIGAFALSEFAEAVAIMLFFAVGELFEDYAEEKSEKAIEDLYGMISDVATVVIGNELKSVDVKDINVGDVLLVRSGEKCAVDGVVTEGESFVDTSMITGESVPKRICVGDKVRSGFVVSGAPVKIRAEKRAEDSSAAKIIELIKDAEEKKAKSEKFITKFAKVYTPVVIALALIVAFLPLAFGGSIFVWGARGINLLIISCPCALVVSVPIAFFAGVGKAFENGVIVKGSSVMERASRVKTYAFDKTGTLTKGEFKVLGVYPEDKREDLLQIAASVERYSSHPIASAIVSAYRGEIVAVDNVEEIAGNGLIGVLNGEKVCVGNKRLMDAQGVDTKDLIGEGTLVYVFSKDLVGLIVIGDESKENSRDLIKELKAEKKRVVMLTGDNAASAGSFARSLGIDEYKGAMLPEDKAKAITEYKTDGLVCFVGDGINDSPVLAAADLSVAMGSGSDIAAECADVVICGDDPYKVRKLNKISRSTMRVVYGNIVCSIAAKLAIFACSVFLPVPMWAAVFADVGVMILATLNSFRLSLKKNF